MTGFAPQPPGMPPGMGHGAMPGATAQPPLLSTGHYEFGPHEGASVGRAGRRTRLWGILSVVFGLLTIVGLLLMAVIFLSQANSAQFVIAIGVVIAALPLALVQLGTGYLYYTAGGHLQQVHESQGARSEERR
ncbi:MAG: hypothetical protein VB934_01595, partial [Polyangiaceae bacterium]